MIDHNMLILGVRELGMTRVIAVSIVSLAEQSSPLEGRYIGQLMMTTVT